LTLIAASALGLCSIVASLRWLRVAQFEHYLPGSGARFAVRWFRSSAVNLAIGLGLVAAAVVGVFVPGALFVAGVLLLVWPVGLGFRGRTRPLRWTRRLRTLAGAEVTLLLIGFAMLAALANAKIAACVVALAVPLLVDVACTVTRPIEGRLSLRFVRRATTRLRAIDPLVVAITGSFGKTSTKEHLRDIVGSARTVVASPASFNNRAGLSRTILEHLVPGTQILIAEMGMYGPGEIADLCSWIRPEIAVITAIAPVHLERLGSIDRIVEAKREILVGARVAVLNVDCPELAALAREIEPSQRVVRCGGMSEDADVVVRRDADAFTIRTPAGVIESVITDPGVEPTNLACAIAVAIEIGVDLETIRRGLSTLQSPAHRCTVAISDAGVVVIDDTFSANLDGTERALRVLAGSGTDGGRRIVVTPGIVELGSRQFDENRGLGEAAGKVADTVVIVGATNRSALRSGTRQTGCETLEVRRREDAVAWVRTRAGRGDVVLYENDLPDHYP
jgi:UDP-N-acetylmuramoyl-tripeptide--D-alanyl-D-alanine ligase